MRLAGSDGAIDAIAIRPDGRLLAAARGDGTIGLWRASWREWLPDACARLEHMPALLERPSAKRALAIAGVSLEDAHDVCRRRKLSPDVKP